MQISDQPRDIPHPNTQTQIASHIAFGAENMYPAALELALARQASRPEVFSLSAKNGREYFRCPVFILIELLLNGGQVSDVDSLMADTESQSKHNKPLKGQNTFVILQGVPQLVLQL